MLYAYPIVGTTGLCNMLITWARAVVFCRDHRAKMIAPAWTNPFRIGPWIRREKDKRLYWGQFSMPEYAGGIRKWVALAQGPRIKECDYHGEVKGVVQFSGHEEGLRAVLKNRELIYSELLKIVHPFILKSLTSLPERFVGVHVRLGDFATIGFALQKDYYIRAIAEAVERSGGRLPILVFSDAREADLAYITERFTSARIMPPAPALQDILALSRSDFLVATNRSTFSAWASVLGDMPTYWDKNGEPPNTFLGLEKYNLI